MLSAGRIAFAALAALCGAQLAAPAPAAAGIYTVSQCNQALSPLQGDAFAEQTSSGYALGGDCATPTGLQVNETGLGTAPDSFGRWVWRAPAGTVFTTLQASASLVGASGQDARLVGVAADGQTVVFGAPGGAYEPADLVSGSFTELRSELRCVSATPCVGVSGSASVRDVLLTTDDSAVPAAAITGGTLFAGKAVRGRRVAEFSVSDEGSGVREVGLRVNGEPVFADVLSCQVVGDLATSLRPCAARATPAVSVSTDEEPFVTGVNTITACGADLALDGLANEACESREVFVDDLCPSARVGAGARLAAGFSSGGRRTLVRSDQRARLRGRLTSDSGDGIGGAKICALTHVDLDDGPYEVADTATTRADGSFSLRLPPGPTREVFVHRVSGDQVLARHGLRVEAKVRPSLEILPDRKDGRVGRGGRLRFKGALPGPGCAGRSVKVQAKVGKRRWQVFRAVRTNSHCRYRTRFKLRETTSPTRYVFRARVPGQPGYPYKPGVSTVRVRMAGGSEG
jgi:hypothetical protein